MARWHSLRGFVAGGFAFIICPCHLPLTLPIVLTVTTGTAVGGWLVNHTPTIYALFWFLFIGGLILMFKWLVGKKEIVCRIEPRKKPSLNQGNPVR